VVLDPITNVLRVGDVSEVQSMLARISDFLKNRGITLLMTSLATGVERVDETQVNMSSLVDTWIAVDLELIGHARRRMLYVVKSRGMEHSHETRELLMSSQGLSLRSLNKETQS
jgi:circadian clock protein KaiC